MQTSCMDMLPTSCALSNSPDPSPTQSTVGTVLGHCARYLYHFIIMAISERRVLLFGAVALPAALQFWSCHVTHASGI
jgi:hypothetical protein